MSAALDGGTEVMVFVYSFAVSTIYAQVFCVLNCLLFVSKVGGAGGRVVDFPHWALNPEGNPDYCKRLT